ncbi:MAG TPA: exodeoxyribonuclease VII large subunit [Burkholderiales bacterium]|nr:exodeoxyribonuclease VII large subunit [Burkholderiales bacterium]
MLDAPQESLFPAQPQVISVAELNRLARNVLERELPLMWVAGEISNCKRYESGHCYFTLKDANAQVDCVIFRNKAQLLGWLPQDGMQVEVRACPTLYEARGKFQLTVETMRRSGLGALYEAFAKLKVKLEREGLFDAARRRLLPRFPRAIGIVTSPQAAALRDVLTTLRRRMPGLQAVVYPTPVQGGAAARSIAAAIGAASARAECDVLILCRGGGSIEDLWAFNEEIVARAIVASAIPVVTGIGHETDFTIADFAADFRAPTPTGAAEQVSPDRGDLARLLAQAAARLARSTVRGLEDRMQRLDYLSRRLTHPGERIERQLGELGHLARRLGACMRHGLDDHAWRARDLGQRLVAGAPDLAQLTVANAELARRLRHAGRHRVEIAATAVASAGAHLKHLSPQHVLDRGYSITETAAGAIVRDGSRLTIGEVLKIRFASGSAAAEVKNKADDGER